jgi:hypothetical protein
MLSSTVLTLVVVPVFYLALDDALDWLRVRLRRRRGPEVDREGAEAKPVAHAR